MTENTWYWNSTQYAPFVYKNSSNYARYGISTTVPRLVADATSINGVESLDFAPAATNGIYGCMSWDGHKSIFGDETTGDFSALYRLKIQTLGYSDFGGFAGPRFQSTDFVSFQWYITSGTDLRVYMADETGNNIFNNQAYVPSLAIDIWYDFLFVWDNTTKALEVFVDNSSLGTATGGRYYGIGALGFFEPNWTQYINCGSGKTTSTSYFNSDEIAYWNYKLSAGERSAFTGASRTDYYGYSATTPASSGGGRVIKSL